VSESPQPVRVLIADDDEGFRGALADLLTAFGHADVVGAARDGREAVELYFALGPDVVFMDVVMPVCDGIEATKRILARDPEARIVALTAGDDYRALALCLIAGAKGCLRKAPDTIKLAPLMLALSGTRRHAGGTPRRSDPRRPPPMSLQRSRIAALAALGALAVAAPVSIADPRSNGVSARLGEFSIKLNRSTASHGRITFSIRNTGEVEHEFIVLETGLKADKLPRRGGTAEEGAAGRVVDEAEGIEPGKTAKLTVRLKPGRYVLLCNLPGHYAGGMRTALRVS
jgi:CheY-like chemotaxis protein